MNDIGNFRKTAGKTITSSWLGMLVVGLGLGSALAYLLLRNAREDRTVLPAGPLLEDHIVDDRGTGQRAALQMLHNLRDRAFEASNEKLALALGRPIEEVSAWDRGQAVIDDDVVMKARGIAMLRGVEIEFGNAFDRQNRLRQRGR